MNTEYCKGIHDLLALFEDTLSPVDALTSKLMAQISSEITKERLKLGMNQSEFAKYIGATQSLVSRWEHGDYNFSIKKIAEVAVALNMDVDFNMKSSVPEDASKNSMDSDRSVEVTSKIIHFPSRQQYPHIYIKEELEEM